MTRIIPALRSQDIHLSLLGDELGNTRSDTSKGHKIQIKKADLGRRMSVSIPWLSIPIVVRGSASDLIEQILFCIKLPWKVRNIDVGRKLTFLDLLYFTNSTLIEQELEVAVISNAVGV